MSDVEDAFMRETAGYRDNSEQATSNVASRDFGDGTELCVSPVATTRVSHKHLPRGIQRDEEGQLHGFPSFANDGPTSNGTIWWSYEPEEDVVTAIVCSESRETDTGLKFSSIKWKWNGWMRDWGVVRSMIASHMSALAREKTSKDGVPLLGIKTGSTYKVFACEDVRTGVANLAKLELPQVSRQSTSTGDETPHDLVSDGAASPAQLPSTPTDEDIASPEPVQSIDPLWSDPTTDLEALFYLSMSCPSETTFLGVFNTSGEVTTQEFLEAFTSNARGCSKNPRTLKIPPPKTPSVKGGKPSVKRRNKGDDEDYDPLASGDGHVPEVYSESIAEPRRSTRPATQNATSLHEDTDMEDGY